MLISCTFGRGKVYLGDLSKIMAAKSTRNENFFGYVD